MSEPSKEAVEVAKTIAYQAAHNFYDANGPSGKLGLSETCELFWNAVQSAITKACAEKAEENRELRRRLETALENSIRKNGDLHRLSSKLAVMKEALGLAQWYPEANGEDYACVACEGSRPNHLPNCKIGIALSTLPVSVLGQEEKEDLGTKP